VDRSRVSLPVRRRSAGSSRLARRARPAARRARERAGADRRDARWLLVAGRDQRRRTRAGGSSRSRSCSRRSAYCPSCCWRARFAAARPPRAAAACSPRIACFAVTTAIVLGGEHLAAHGRITPWLFTPLRSVLAEAFAFAGVFGLATRACARIAPWIGARRYPRARESRYRWRSASRCSWSARPSSRGSGSCRRPRSHSLRAWVASRRSRSRSRSCRASWSCARTSSSRRRSTASCRECRWLPGSQALESLASREWVGGFEAEVQPAHW